VNVTPSEVAEENTVLVDNPVAVLLARRRILETAQELGLDTVESTMLATAVSELARNVLEHGGGGTASWEVLNVGNRCGLKVTFVDEGEGIRDLSSALSDGFTTGGGMGVGLPGAKRLVDELEIESTVGVGTKIDIVKWIRTAA
jgi:serine/threonine-protein kinase RsbT